MIRVLNHEGSIVNVDNEDDLHRLLELGAEELDIAIFGPYAMWADDTNTHKVEGVWRFTPDTDEIDLRYKESAEDYLDMRLSELVGSDPSLKIAYLKSKGASGDESAAGRLLLKLQKRIEDAELELEGLM